MYVQDVRNYFIEGGGIGGKAWKQIKPKFLMDAIIYYSYEYLPRSHEGVFYLSLHQAL